MELLGFPLCNYFELINDAVFVSTPEQLYSFNSKNVFQKKLNPSLTSFIKHLKSILY